MVSGLQYWPFRILNLPLKSALQIWLGNCGSNRGSLLTIFLLGGFRGTVRPRFFMMLFTVVSEGISVLLWLRKSMTLIFRAPQWICRFRSATMASSMRCGVFKGWLLWLLDCCSSASQPSSWYRLMMASPVGLLMPNSVQSQDLVNRPVSRSVMNFFF